MVKQILIVDDEEAIRASLSAVLNSRGYAVDTAATAREALIKNQALFHHLAFLDINLPDMKGTELLGLMRKSQPHMKIIMITGNPAVDTAIASVNFGADGFITKPVASEKLLSVVERKLKEQDDSLALNDEKVAEWLENRLMRLDSENTDNTDPR